MSDQIENVAQAIFEANSGPWRFCSESGKEATRHKARAAIKAANQWLAIESAPRDGTRILGLTPAGSFTIYWMDEQSVSDCGLDVVYAGWWSDGGVTRPGSNMGDPGNEDEAQAQPTGWMPLPAAQNTGGGA